MASPTPVLRMLRVNVSSEDGRNSTLVSSTSDSLTALRQDICVHLGVPLNKSAHLQLSLKQPPRDSTAAADTMGTIIPCSGTGYLKQYLPIDCSDDGEDVISLNIVVDNCSKFSTKTAFLALETARLWIARSSDATAAGKHMSVALSHLKAIVDRICTATENDIAARTFPLAPIDSMFRRAKYGTELLRQMGFQKQTQHAVPKLVLPVFVSSAVVVALHEMLKRNVIRELDDIDFVFIRRPTDPLVLASPQSESDSWHVVE